MALLYVLVAVAWVVISDLLVAHLRPADPANLWLQLAKGGAFILATGVALYALLRRARHRELRARRRANAMRLLGVFSDGILHDRPLGPLLANFTEGLRREFELLQASALEITRDGRLLPLRGDALEERQAADMPVAPAALREAIERAEAWLELEDAETLAAVSAPGSSSAKARVLVFGLKGGEGRRGALLLVGEARGQAWADACRLLPEVARSLALAWETACNRPRLAVLDCALRESANAIVITDAEGRVVWVNAAFERSTGYGLAVIRGRGLGFLRSGAHPDAFYDRLWRILREGRGFAGEFVNRRRDGSLVTVQQTITPVHGEDGRITHYLAVQEDVTERRETQAQLLYLRRHDSLTGLPNRAAFAEALREQLARPERIALLMIDIDRFRNLNSMLGYEAGDQVLREVVARLRLQCGPDDHLARLGGNEFALLRRRAERSGELSQLAERLLQAIGRPILVAGRELEVRASIGIALHPDDTAAGADPMANAEVAQRRCKREGGDGYRFFSPTLDAAARATAELEQELRAAPTAGELELYYQPLVKLDSGVVVGAEALLRWRHPRLGLLGPDRFIGLAEETGLILPIGDWVLRRAAAQARDWEKAGLPPLRLGVNLSFAQFADAALAERVAEALRESGLSPDRLELELTESMLARDMELAVATCDRLRALGVLLAIDDFGTGYSSLSHLHRFAVDHVKIDRSFVSNLEQGEGPQAIVRATIAMARALGCAVVAEGVETEPQRRFLAELGCAEAQGYLFARPMPAEDFEAFMRRIEGAPAPKPPPAPRVARAG